MWVISKSCSLWSDVVSAHTDQCLYELCWDCGQRAVQSSGRRLEEEYRSDPELEMAWWVTADDQRSRKVDGRGWLQQWSRQKNTRYQNQQLEETRDTEN